MSSFWNERAFRWLWLALTAVHLSCTTHVTNVYIDDGASDGDRVSTLVDASSTATLMLKNGARLEVPEGSVPQPVRLALERLPDSRASELVRGAEPSLRPLGAPHVLTPHGTRFENEVDLTLPMNGMLRAGRQLAAVWLEDEDDQVWKRLDAPEVTGTSVKVKLRHFSVVMLAEVEEGVELGTGVDEEVDAATADATDDGAVEDAAEDAAVEDATDDAQVDAADGEVTTVMDASADGGSTTLDASPSPVQDAEAGIDPCMRDGAVCCGAPRKLCSGWVTAASALVPGCARDWQDAEVCGISSVSNPGTGVPPFLEKQAPGTASPSCGDLLDRYDAVGDGGLVRPDASTTGNQRLDVERIIGAASFLMSTPACCTPGGACSLDTGRGRVFFPPSTEADSNAGYGCMAPAWAFPTRPEAQKVACDPVTGVRTGALP